MKTFAPSLIASLNHKEHVENVFNAASAFVTTAQKLTALNLDAARNALHRSVASTHEVLLSKTPHEAVQAASRAHVQGNLEAMLDYISGLNEIAAQHRHAVFEYFDNHLTHHHAAVTKVADDHLSKIPGTEAAIEAVKHTVAVTSAAYDKMKRNTHEAAAAAENKITELAQATSKALTTMPASLGGVAGVDTEEIVKALAASTAKATGTSGANAPRKS